MLIIYNKLLASESQESLKYIILKYIKLKEKDVR